MLTLRSAAILSADIVLEMAADRNLEPALKVDAAPSCSLLLTHTTPDIHTTPTAHPQHIHKTPAGHPRKPQGTLRTRAAHVAHAKLRACSFLSHTHTHTPLDIHRASTRRTQDARRTRRTRGTRGNAQQTWQCTALRAGLSGLHVQVMAKYGRLCIIGSKAEATPVNPCLSLTFHCPFTACPLPFHCLSTDRSLTVHCLFTTAFH